MKKLLLFLTCCLPGFLFAQWRNNTLVESTINDITFTDRYTGYAVFPSTVFGSCPSTHGLFRTIDEGQNWIRVNTGTSNNVVAVHFANQLTGWIAASGSEIRKTVDGGANWVQQTVGVGSGYNDIYFKDLNTGFVAGNNGLLRRSVNGGSTWTTITSGVTGTLRRIFFATSNVGYIACSANQLLKTTDGGNSWSVIAVPSPGFNDIFFTSATVGYASTGLNVAKTTDGGQTWSNLNTGLSNPATRVFFPTASIGYVCVSGEGIYKTTDAGATWSLTRTPNGALDGYSVVHFVDQNTGYVAGAYGYIAKTTDGGQNWYNKTAGLVHELFTVHAPHKDTAYMGGEQGHIYKTENGGTTFFQQARLAPGASNVQKVWFLDPDHGFAVLDSGRIFKTTNGGTNWVQKPTNTLQGITDIQFVTPTIGYATTVGGGLVLKSTDTGETWTSIVTGTVEPYTDLWFLNPDTGFVMNGLKIQRTMNGGLTWTPYTPVGASQLRDIIFVNDSVGFCGGSFGKVLYTTNTGTNWFATNSTIVNAEITDMWAVSANEIFVARTSSQERTVDSCKTFSSIPTACLANNSTMNAISMTDGGTHGYCAGAYNGVLHQSGVPEIIRAYTSTNAYCPGSTIFVAYHAKGLFSSGCVFTAQLSDANGSFAAPTNIGTYTPTTTVYQSGVITAMLPGGSNGSNYRIRVISSNPSIISPDNGYPITISNSLQPTVTLQSSIQSPVCIGTTFHFTTSNFAGGLNPSFVWTVNGNPVTNTGNSFITNALQDGDVVQVSMTSSLTCANPAPALSNAFTAIITQLALNVGNDTAICRNSTLQLSAPSGYNYAWTPTNGLSSNTIPNPVATIDSTIIYHLTITDSLGCTGTDSIFITAKPLPQFSLGADTIACIQDSITLQGPSGYTYDWQPSTGLSNPNAQSPQAAITGNIQYILTVTDTAGCSGLDSITISAFALPPFSLGADTTVCENTTLALNGPSGYSYAWLPTTGLSNPSVQSPNAVITSNIQYTLSIFDSLGCSSSDSISIIAAALPQISLGNDTTICAGDCAPIQGSVTGTTAQIAWSPGSALSDSTIINPIACPTATAAYTVTVTSTDQCSSSASILITVNPAPPQPQVTFNGILLSTDPATTYQWLLNGTPIPGATSMTYQPTVNGNYSVILTNSDGCTSESQPLPVIINGFGSHPSLWDVQLYPNPTKDEVFLHLSQVPLSPLSVRIYEANGALVYHGQTADAATFRIPTDAFAAGIYTLSITSEFGIAHKRLAIVK